MSRLIFVALCFSFLLPVGLSGQPVRLNRLERALGADSAIVSNATGVARWQPISSLGFVSGSGTANVMPMWSNSNTLTDGYISWTGTSIQHNHPSGSDIFHGSSTFGYSGTGAPLLSAGSSIYTFSGDTDSGLKRTAANAVSIAAGSLSNWIATFDGSAALVTFDPDLNGTADVSISATTTSVEALTASGLITANGAIDFNANSTSDTEWLVGTDASGLNTRVILGEEFDLGDGTVHDTLHLSATINAYLMAYDDNVGSSQSFSLTGPASYDTLNIAVTGVLESGIEYGAPNPSADSAIIFNATGIYEIHFHYTGELSSATTNQTLRAKWVKNSSTSATGSAFSWGYETTARQTYSQSFIYSATAGDFLQFLVSPGTGGAATLTMVTPKITVTRIK